mmetsp:Transcript_34437/g.83025  ORF Transcript_34437/g.83025 Transcript_34437/m.83025 type:complete len:138 (+) Transcript_34437:507-920(+)
MLMVLRSMFGRIDDDTVAAVAVAVVTTVSSLPLFHRNDLRGLLFQDTNAFRPTSFVGLFLFDFKEEKKETSWKLFTDDDFRRKGRISKNRSDRTILGYIQPPGIQFRSRQLFWIFTNPKKSHCLSPAAIITIDGSTI